MNKLKKIWKDRNKILEGITNAMIRDEFVEDVARHRMEVCEACEFLGDKCLVPGTSPCCNECGCSLSFKTRSLSSECPKGKWKALLSEEEEDNLDNFKN